MGATYTRQSSSTITDGSVIEASHFNNEFDQLLAAFAASTGHTHDGTSAEGGPITKLLGNTLTFGAATAGTDITITFDGETSDGVLKWMEDEDYFEFSDDILVASTEKLQFRDTAIYINSSADGQLDLFADTEIQIAATTIDINGAVALNGAITGATNITLSGELDAATLDISGDADIDGTLETDALSINGTTVTSTAAELNILDGVTATATELNIMDGVTATTAELNIMDGVTSTAAELNLVDGITAGTVSASKAVIVDSNKDLTGFRNLTISGDLTVSGDDITMGTNTAGNVLVADGTNFNSIAVGDLSEISSVASDDVLMAVDTSGGGLKKIARSTLVSGLASSSALSNVVEDTSPQLGGDLDMNGADIVTTSNADLELAPNGTGHVTVKGNTNSGAIQFNCENNSHGQIVKAQPHSAGVTNELLLPAGSNSTLVSLVSTDTLTNKTLTTPVIAEIDSGADITLDATADIILDAGGGDFNFKDDGTEILRISNSSSDVIIRPVVDAKDLIFQQRDGTEVARVEDNGTFNIVTDKLAINGTAVTSTGAELNILDGVTSTATELNIIDGDTSASSVTLADADRMVINDGGTMKQVAVTDMTTYINSNASFATKGFATAMSIAL